MLLVAAGTCDVVLAALLGLFPATLFGWLGMGVPGKPGVWRLIAVVVGMFGLLYLHAARRERARPILAAGLAGKVFALAAWLTAAHHDREIARMFPLVALSSLVWWVPFAARVLAGTRIAGRVRAATPWVCAGLHGAAGFAMALVLRGGTEAEPSPAARMAYVAAHAAAWRAGFAVWMAAGMSVLALYAWWASALPRARLAVAAVVIAGAGLACDLAGESLYAGWLPLLTGDAAAFDYLQRVGTVLTSVFANGFYTLAGIVLTLGTPGLPRRVRTLAWVVWAAGIALSVCAAIGWATGLVATSGVLFPALVLVALLLPRALR
ncbi:MAG TPA: hypothetical protein VFJ82_17575 [Longimicrobium sp.]|nr:hypothetical protein [Longimicrobium sp.]